MNGQESPRLEVVRGTEYTFQVMVRRALNPAMGLGFWAENPSTPKT